MTVTGKAPPLAPSTPPRRRWAPPGAYQALVWALIAGWAALFSYLSVARYRAFWTGRFDLGNMVQAVWSTAHGHPLESTDIAGRQFVRLGSHVDPILLLFTPLAWTGALPQLMLVAQALIVALGALPAFWLGRRWLGDERWGAAAAAVYLLYPPLQWATVTEFHAVTLAAPLLLFCVWAAEERRYWTLSAFAVLAALTKEEVGLALAVLALWMAVRGLGRRYAAGLAAASLAWVAVAMLVIIPHFNEGRGTEFVNRYGDLGSDGGEIARTLLTRPWEAAEVLWSLDRLAYLGALLAPLLLLALAAPLLAAAALPELLLNLLASWWPQYSIRFQYVAVIVPFLVAASILGLARLRSLRRPPAVARALSRAGPLIAVWVAAPLIAGIFLGPLPWWSDFPGASQVRIHEFRTGPHSRTLDQAVALIPDDVPVSAGNLPGSHLSERRHIYTFPVIADAQWVILDQQRPYLGDRLSPRGHPIQVDLMRARPDFRLVFDRDGVLVFEREAGS